MATVSSSEDRLRDLMRMVIRAKEISRQCIYELPDEVANMIREGVRPGGGAWWLIMYELAIDSLGITWLPRFYEERD